MKAQCDGIRYEKPPSARNPLILSLAHHRPLKSLGPLVRAVKISVLSASMRQRKARVDGLPFGAETRFSNRNETKFANFWPLYR